MGKSRRRGRRGESRQTTADTPAPAGSSKPATSPPPDPPRRNFTLLILSGTLLLLWLVFLAGVAMFG